MKDPAGGTEEAHFKGLDVWQDWERRAHSRQSSWLRQRTWYLCRAHSCAYAAMAEQRHSQSPPASQLWVEPSAYHIPRSPHTPQHAHGARPSALLTHRRRTHTTHSAVAGAPPRGMTQRLASISPHSGLEPSSPGGGSPTAQGASVSLPTPSAHTPTSLSLPRPAH